MPLSLLSAAADTPLALIHPLLILICSLAENYVGPELGKYMAEALMVNKTLTSLEYATNHPSPSHLTVTLTEESVSSR